ncbi:MAG: GGDEF domain-containing protein [Solirubrobacteraceae bacterium]|nr:GGDEF domain-containing protein [Solirubrobacteraceae bacterium]
MPAGRPPIRSAPAWPWLLAVIVVGVVGVVLLSVLDEREEQAQLARAHAVAIEKVVDDAVADITDLQARLGARRADTVIRALVQRRLLSRSALLPDLQRLAPGPETDALARVFREIGAATLRRDLNLVDGLRRYAPRARAAARRTAATQQERAESIAQRTRLGQIAIVVLMLTIVALILWRSRSALMRASEAYTDELRHLAEHDTLTGLGNRRHLDEEGALLVHAATSTAPVGVLLLDLDGFKAYNDTAGHAAGDDLLVDAARAFERALGADGHAYRLGGDEFCGITRAPDPDLPRRVEDALLAAFAGRGPSASVGMALVPTETDDLAAAMRLADTRMYAVKRGKGVARATAG